MSRGSNGYFTLKIIMDKSKYVELARKLLALKIQWVGWEAENAARQLDVIMKKYDITLTEIWVEERKERCFTVPTRWIMRKFFFQVWAKTIPQVTQYHESYWKHRVYIELTDREYLEFSQAYEVYKKALTMHLYKQRQVAYRAFIEKNDIFRPDDWSSRERPSKPITKEEMEIIMEAMAQADRMQSTSIHKALT